MHGEASVNFLGLNLAFGPAVTGPARVGGGCGAFAPAIDARIRDRRRSVIGASMMEDSMA